MRPMIAAAAVAAIFVFAPIEKAEAKACGHAWAIPGSYSISGDFRGKVESAGAKLSRNCRVNIKVPGVYSGTKVRRAGNCLTFGFKIKGVKRAFTAKWCNKIGVIPWKGRQIRASVLRQQLHQVRRGTSRDVHDDRLSADRPLLIDDPREDR